MTNTYNPVETNKDQVRLLIGDTAEPWDMADEEIDHFLTANGDTPIDAAIDCATTLVSKYAAKSAAASVGPFSIDYAAKSNAYKDVLAALRRMKNSKHPATAWISGTNRRDNPLFEIGMMDAEGSQDYYNVSRDTDGSSEYD
jgi:hypothetical protein